MLRSEVGHEQHGVVEADGIDGHRESQVLGGTGGQATTPKPPVQETFSLAARVICRKPRLSSSRARFRAPASIAFRPPEVTTPARVDLASASSPAMSTVVVSGPTVPAASVPAKVVLNAFRTSRLGEGSGDLRGRGAVGGDGQGVEGLEVQRVGDVDDDLAGEAVAALGDDGADGGVGDREDDDVAAHRGGAVVLAEQLDGVAALAGDGGDGLAHVAGADDGEVCHGVLLKRME